MLFLSHDWRRFLIPLTLLSLLLVAALSGGLVQAGSSTVLQGSVKELQTQLFDIRGESVVLNEEMKSRKEQLSELRERVARLRANLASVEKQSKDIANTMVQEKTELKLALQVLSEEMERLLPRDQIQNQLIGGIPVDSEYIIFVIVMTLPNGELPSASAKRASSRAISMKCW